MTLLGPGPNPTAHGLSAGSHRIFLQALDGVMVVKSESILITIKPNTIPPIVSFAPLNGQPF
ncbi:MAG: hypothetical protein QXW06_05830 [Thermoplasmata archaeon]